MASKLTKAGENGENQSHNINKETALKDELPASKTSTQSGPTAPPNGGTQAWLQVLGSWCLVFNTWG